MQLSGFYDSNSTSHNWIYNVMTNKANIGLDSQCYTYLISALENLCEPTDALSEERKSLVRIFFYCSPPFWLSPKVVDEYNGITDATKLQMHQSWHGVHFLNFNPPPDTKKVNEVAATLKALHSHKNDCIIISEYMLYGINTVLSYDADLIRNLQNSGLSIIRPSEYWKKANITKGTRPLVIPHPTNPLSDHSWWQW